MSWNYGAVGQYIWKQIYPDLISIFWFNHSPTAFECSINHKDSKLPAHCMISAKSKLELRARCAFCWHQDWPIYKMTLQRHLILRRKNLLFTLNVWLTINSRKQSESLIDLCDNLHVPIVSVNVVHVDKECWHTIQCGYWQIHGEIKFWNMKFWL